MDSERLRLKENHTWKSKPGYAICVIDRGVVRFDYPSHWIVQPEEGSVHLHDCPPSAESCDLGVSIFPVDEAYAREVSLDDTLRDTVTNERQPYEQSEIYHITRGDLDIAWLEQRYTDAECNRDARFRVALARGSTLCLISMNYWTSQAGGLEPVWDEVLRTLVMGVHVEDPTAGPSVQ